MSRPRSILAIDPARKSGWALWEGGEVLNFGHLDIGGPTEHEGSRLLRWREEVRHRITSDRPSCIAYEQPTGHRGRASVRLSHHLEAELLAEAARAKVPAFGVAPAAMKKHVTGNGRAGKDAVRAAVCGRFGLAANQVTEDEADALGVLAWSLDQTETETS